MIALLCQNKKWNFETNIKHKFYANKNLKYAVCPQLCMQNVWFISSFSQNHSREQLWMSWGSKFASMNFTRFSSRKQDFPFSPVSHFPNLSLSDGSNSKSLAHSSFYWGLDLLMWNAWERSKCLSVVICFLANHFNSPLL